MPVDLLRAARCIPPPCPRIQRAKPLLPVPTHAFYNVVREKRGELKYLLPTESQFDGGGDATLRKLRSETKLTRNCARRAASCRVRNCRA